MRTADLSTICSNLIGYRLEMVHVSGTIRQSVTEAQYNKQASRYFYEPCRRADSAGCRCTQMRDVGSIDCIQFVDIILWQDGTRARGGGGLIIRWL